MIFVRSSGGCYLDIECEYPCLIDISGVGLEVNVPVPMRVSYCIFADYVYLCALDGVGLGLLYPKN